MKPWHLEEHPDLEEQRRTSVRTWAIPERRKPLTRKQYVELFMRQDGRCGCCQQRLAVKGGDEIEVRDEHVNPLWRGGTNELWNRELWCKPCTKPKDSQEATERFKGERVRDKYIGAFPKKPQSRFRKKLNGQVVCRETGEVIGGRS